MRRQRSLDKKERQASDEQAVKTFDFLSDGESEQLQNVHASKAKSTLQPLVDHLPNSNFALALMVEGLNAIKQNKSPSLNQNNSKNHLHPWQAQRQQ